METSYKCISLHEYLEALKRLREIDMETFNLHYPRFVSLFASSSLPNFIADLDRAILNKCLKQKLSSRILDLYNSKIGQLLKDQENHAPDQESLLAFIHGSLVPEDDFLKIIRYSLFNFYLEEHR